MIEHPIKRRFTVAEYYRMGEAEILREDDRVELIDGEIMELAPVSGPHAASVMRINRLFRRALVDQAIVSVHNPLRLGDRSEPVPDVMLLRRIVDFYAASHPTVADVYLVVEVSDTTLQHHQQVKLPLYARHGVPEVWIADLTGGLILIHREPTRSGYRISETKQRGDHLAPSAFPDLSFAVEDILG